MQLEPYQQRVVDERTALDEKIEKLNTFLLSPTSSKLEDEEQRSFGCAPANGSASVLFLEVDGVLNNWDCANGLDGGMLELVRHIIRETGCKIVLSSCWRKYERLRSRVEAELPIHDVTPELGVPHTRGHEIAEWIFRNNFAGRFTILDDNTWKGPLSECLLRTDTNIGLTADIAAEAIRRLNNSQGMSPCIAYYSEKLAEELEKEDTNSVPSSELPKFKNVKDSSEEISAFLIEIISGIVNGGDKTIKLSGKNCSIEVDSRYCNLNSPEVGGYYIRYQNGVESYMPAENFLSNYSPVIK